MSVGGHITREGSGPTSTCPVLCVYVHIHQNTLELSIQTPTRQKEVFLLGYIEKSAEGFNYSVHSYRKVHGCIFHAPKIREFYNKHIDSFVGSTSFILPSVENIMPYDNKNLVLLCSVKVVSGNDAQTLQGLTQSHMCWGTVFKNDRKH